jgi:hypothetical protein
MFTSALLLRLRSTRLRITDGISARVTKVDSVTTKIQPPDSLSNNAPTLVIEWDAARTGITGQELHKLMLDTEPRIILEGGSGSRPHQMDSSVAVMPYMMMPGDDKIVAERLYALLSKPPKFEDPVEPAGVSVKVEGRWDVVVEYRRGSARHTLTFEQNDGALTGTHQGEIVSGDLKGELKGNQVRARASHPIEGTVLEFGFVGMVEGDRMSGTVNLGEYGGAKFTAERHKYA